MADGDTIVIRENAKARQAVAFDGTDDYILADAHAAARVLAADTTGTYSAWILMDSVAGATILSVGDNNSATELFKFQVLNGELKAYLYHGGAIQFNVTQTVGTITANKWIHVAVVQDGVQPALYVNGLNVAATNDTATDLTAWYDVLTACDKFAIGVLESNATHTADFAGMISDVKYWNRALTEAEIKLDYDGTAQVDDATYLQSWWDMDGDVTDAGLGADNGTLTGNAYNCGYGSAWSRRIQLDGVVIADEINTFSNPDGTNTTIILKAA